MLRETRQGKRTSSVDPAAYAFAERIGFTNPPIGRSKALVDMRLEGRHLETSTAVRRSI